jgi:hypothetical protein
MLWRLCVIDGQARKVHPRLVWPHGAESEFDRLAGTGIE